MDFTNRDINQNQSRQSSSLGSESQEVHSSPKRGRKSAGSNKLFRIFQGGLLVCGTILVVAVLLSISTAKNNTAQEALYVDTGKHQAVFLNGGQVYFGKIVALNNNYLTLADIYYLQVNQPVQPGEKDSQNNFTLAKLGCELHRPQDVMVINREQIIFWENLKDEEGANTVPGAIKSYKESTDGKQDCEAQQPEASEGGDATTETDAPDTTDSQNRTNTDNTAEPNNTTPAPNTNN